MANPFSVEVVNPLQALLVGQSSYDNAQKSAAAQQKQSALATLLQGGQFDPNKVAGVLLAAGDTSGAGTFAGLAGTQAQREYTQKHDAVNDARNAANDARAASQFQQTYALQKQTADRLADKTPANFIKNDDGSYAAIPGSAADPAFIQRQADAWKGSGTSPQTVMPGAAIVRPGTGEVIYKNSPESTLDKSTLETMADQYLSGDTSVFQNLGRGAQGAENVTKLRNIIAERGAAKNMGGADMAQRSAEFMGEKAAQRTLGTRGVNADMAVTEAQNMVGLGRDASANVPRTQWQPVNKAMNAYRTQSGDPNIVKFGAANLAIINTYARAISPTGTPTVHDKEHAETMLSTAQTPEQYNAVLDQLQLEMKAAQAAPGQVKQDRRSQFLGNDPHAAAPKMPAPPKVGESRNGYIYAGGNPADPNSWKAAQ